MQKYQMHECADDRYLPPLDVYLASDVDQELAQANLDWDILAADARKLTHERDTLRDVLRLLAPDLKTMAILYAQQGDHQRSQALANICKSVGVE